jgi:DNA-directed RNA polymerase subunit E'/Rpb7
MTSPYIETELYTSIALMPYRLNNALYTNLKDNLRKSIVGKCNKYGYVVRIYEILNYKTAEIIPENFMATSTHEVQYTCRLCSPIKNTQIICKVAQVNRAIIKAVNGPIIAIITSNRYNPNNFTLNNKGNIAHGNELLKVNDLIKINIIAKKFYTGDTEIRVMGTLENIADEKETKMFEKDIYNNEKGDRFVDPTLVNQAIYVSSTLTEDDETILEDAQENENEEHDLDDDEKADLKQNILDSAARKANIEKQQNEETEDEQTN